MKKLVLFFAVIMIIIAQVAMAQTSVTPGDGTLRQAIEAAQSGEVLQLVPGGIYSESTNDDFGTMTDKTITIEIESGGTEPAKVQILKASTDDDPTSFFVLADGSSIILKGLELDGSFNGNASAGALINFDVGQFPGNTTIGKIQIENCSIHDLTDHIIKAGNSEMRGYLVIDSTLIDNVVIQNTGTSIYYKYAGANFISVKNSTFNTIFSYGLRIAGPGESTMTENTPTVVIDQTTWYNTGTTDGREMVVLEKGPNLNPWTVTNSIFVKQINKDKIVVNIKETTGDSLGTITNICMWDVGKKAWRNHTVRDTVTMDPQFADPDNGDFTLPAGSPLLTFGSDGQAIGDPRWATNAPSTVKPESDLMAPVTFSLSQNYPNPFNPETNIAFSLAKSGRSNLSVFDLLGREVAVLVNGNLSAGEHSIVFDASQLPSGVYFYRLSSSGKTLTQKMLLMR